MTILIDRQADNIRDRMHELCRHSGKISRQQMQDLFARAFLAGVSAHSDHVEAARQRAMDKERARLIPFAIIETAPGNLIKMARGEA